MPHDCVHVGATTKEVTIEVRLTGFILLLENGCVNKQVNLSCVFCVVTICRTTVILW